MYSSWHLNLFLHRASLAGSLLYFTSPLPQRNLGLNRTTSFQPVPFPCKGSCYILSYELLWALSSTRSKFNPVLVPKIATMFLGIITSYDSLPCTQYNFLCGNCVKLLLKIIMKVGFFVFLSHKIYNLDTRSK